MLGLAGIRLLDPLEVFYIPESHSLIPIISKSGCSSIKEALIRNYVPGFESSFPEIHQVNPSALTNGKLVRLFFYRFGAYADFVKGKKMYLALRDPAKRFISCYKDVASGKNIMYEYPSGLNKWTSFGENLDFESFSKKVYKTPDYLSDRHFRSQSYFLPDTVAEQLESLQIFDLKTFFKECPLIPHDYSDSGRVLNQSESQYFKHPGADELMDDMHFKRRYARDIFLFNQAQLSEQD